MAAADAYFDAIILRLDGSGITEANLDWPKLQGARAYRASREEAAAQDNILYVFSCVLDHATGGLLSKTNYTKETCYAAIDDYIMKMCDEAVAEAAEDLKQRAETAERRVGEMRLSMGSLISYYEWLSNSSGLKHPMQESLLAQCRALLAAPAQQAGDEVGQS